MAVPHPRHPGPWPPTSAPLHFPSVPRGPTRRLTPCVLRSQGRDHLPHLWWGTAGKPFALARRSRIFEPVLSPPRILLIFCWAIQL